MTDGYEIRRLSTENNVTIFTSLDTVRVLLDVLDENTITIAATAAPHAEILEFAEELVEAKGYKLDIKVFSDYCQIIETD